AHRPSLHRAGRRRARRDHEQLVRVEGTLEKQVRELYSAEKIGGRVRELGAQIHRDYGHGEVVLVGVLKGSFCFLADLARAIPSTEVRVDFLGLASYGDETTSSGVVQITTDLTKPVEGKHVIVVEDIVDTGLTMDYLMENLRTRHPASVKLC